MKKYNVAIAVNKPLALSIFDSKDLDFLSDFANFNPIDGLPEEMTTSFIEDIISNADAIITGWGTPPLTDELLEKAGKLRLISHSAGSIKHLVPKSFWDSKVRIASSAPILASDVAQTVMALLLCSLKQLWALAKSTRDGTWSGGEAHVLPTYSLYGLRIGIVGASMAGRAVIELLRPFGCEIVLYDPYLSPMDIQALGISSVSLCKLISTSDVISLHAPAIDECRHMINKDNIPTMKDGALLINTARGSLIDEEALVKELETGRIYACIDVTDPEPPSVDHPFRKLKNVILTPHIAGGQSKNIRHMLGSNAINEIYGYLTKGLLRFEVRQEMLERMA